MHLENHQSREKREIVILQDVAHMLHRTVSCPFGSRGGNETTHFTRELSKQGTTREGLNCYLPVELHTRRLPIVNNTLDPPPFF